MGPFFFFQRNSMGKVVGLTYDVREEYVFKDGDPVDAHAEFDHEITIATIAQAIGKQGHRVVRIGNASSLLKHISALDVDIVFNISEGMSGRNRESQVPIILEMHNIPYVGSDGLTLALTLDKVMAKKILIAENIPTPRFAEVHDAAFLDGKVDHLAYPLIVKARHEGSSKGITEASRVENKNDLKRQIEFITTSYKQPALIEEFIRGSEFTVGIIGNENPLVMPAVQIEIDGELNLGDKFYTFARISSPRLQYICPARVPESFEKKLRELALKTYHAVECKDFGRVDFRVDGQGNPYVLEINPLPSLSVEDIFMIVTGVLKMTYDELIGKILQAGLARYGLQ